MVTYLESGDDGVEVLLVFMEGHVLEGGAPIWEASVVRPEEDGDHEWRVVAAACRRENLVQHLQSPPRVVATVPSQHHIRLSDPHST